MVISLWSAHGETVEETGENSGSVLKVHLTPKYFFT